MTNTSWLAKFLKWMFAIFTVFAALGTVAFCIVWMIGPNMPPGLHLGPHTLNILGQPGTVALSNSTFNLTALHGNLRLSVDQATGFVETLRHYGLPVLILKAAFFAALFELLRRLFSNVGRGESFTHQNVRLVQIIGLSLMAFSLVFAAAENWFAQAMYSYLAQHAVLSVSGTPLRLPTSHHISINGNGFPFGTPLFFSGLLVLALSEVFRQGLVLKRDSELTI
ncbi:MAG: DUF2975 domain-containing protein [Alphaproteobacteria bacterium]|nr:DUF2975 domain-containing protein [Alphaproteobacteria bacterium]MDE2266320.1 DUF2975 domain-containing protein [Alphaproteobacteria bacterium]MDE2498927.1 DUF2975 domain-containing protein [Alphaproteobacteria bacterium]